MDGERFIADHCMVAPAPLVPELRFHLADDADPIWGKDEAELQALGLASPFWAFAWGGGQALARFILDAPHPIANKRILDFASGCGVAALASARAGARNVTASEIDEFALQAITLNAQLNGLDVSAVWADLVGQQGPWDVVLAGDVFYENELGETIGDWLEWLHGQGTLVLIGDPGRHYLPKSKLECVARYSVKPSRSLEDHDVGCAKVWRFA